MTVASPTNPRPILRTTARRLLYAALLGFCIMPAAAAQATGPPQTAGRILRELHASTWVGQLPNGRELPDRDDCGPRRKDRFVGIFYFLWLGAHSQSGPHDVTRLLAENTKAPNWGPPQVFHHWGEPELDYYLSTDPYVFRRHASMLIDAGVDVIFLDVTNGPTYLKQLDALAKTWLVMRREGNRTPQIAFLTNSRQEMVAQRLYETVYKPGKYRELWFEWKGKPLLLANPDQMPTRVRSFFTLRHSWAWSHAKWFGEGRDKWAWIDDSPQEAGWHKPGVAEQVPVSAAGHPTRNVGRSHWKGKQPPPSRTYPDRCLYFREQFHHARRLDPEIIFVTGWNEWVAQRFLYGSSPEGSKSFLGNRLKPGQTYFVDQYDQEFSRDIEPMRGGHGDRYYRQLVAEVRRYKGVHELPPYNGPHRIEVDGRADDWANVEPEFLDTLGDAKHRDHPGWGESGRLIDRSGRNDLALAKVAYDDDRVIFLVQTHGELCAGGRGAWMLLLIDEDQDRQTGWEGYDYVVAPTPDEPAAVYALDRERGKRVTRRVARGQCAIGGQTIELSLPRDLFNADHSPRFDFHWYDSNQPLESLADLKERGDSAPNRSFNYRFDGPT